MRTVAGTLFPSHATIPSTNPTSPTEPQNFRADLSNDTASFAWDEPLTIPQGTLYSLLSAPFTVSVPGSMTMIYEGVATAKVVRFSASSPQWFWVQARASSYYSLLVPGSFGLGLAPSIPNYSPPAGWSASVAPAGLFKSGSGSTLTTGYASVTVNGGTTPVYSWHNPTSVSAIINNPSGASTTLTASGMGAGEVRSGVVWCRVSDNAGANVASLQVSLTFMRPDYS